MGYFDEEEKNAPADDMSALAESKTLSKEEKAAEKEKLRQEKQREKELKQREKLEKKRQKKRDKGLFVEDIDEKMSGLAQPEIKEESATDQAEASISKDVSGEEKKTVPEDAAAKTETVKAAVTEGEEKKEAEAGIKTEEAAGEEPEEEGKKKRRRKKKEKPEDVNIVKDLLSLIIYIGIVIVICFLIITYVGRRTTVHGDSMNPTLESGDSLWVNMLAYRFGDPERYDIIVFPYEEDVMYIKRIIGLPGETVQITKTGEILINGEVLHEPKQFATIVTPGVASSPITLGPDEYFVLGDNRVNSKDSRYAAVGNIKRERIVGKAVFRLTPLKKFGSID